MDIKKRDFLAASIGAGVGFSAPAAMAQVISAVNTDHAHESITIRVGDGGKPVNSGIQPSSVDLGYKPRRINKAIELWEDGQPIYYDSSGLGPGVDPYAQGIRMARTYMDAINVEMEHGALDFGALREFMRGLVDGGPTHSGHRTPSVFVETGIIGLDEAYMRANSWVIQQLLDCGVHGIHMCHARDTRAVQVATQMACRYPFDRPGIPKLPMRGLRGSSANYAAQCWGVDVFKYNHLADLWPLNPKGELIFGVKIEDTYADQQAASTIALPGIAMAEWGQGDHSYWLYGLDVMPENGPQLGDEVNVMPDMIRVRDNVRDLCMKNNVKYLWGGSPNPKDAGYVLSAIKAGAMVLEGPEEAAVIGREYTKRKMPV